RTMTTTPGDLEPKPVTDNSTELGLIASARAAQLDFDTTTTEDGRIMLNIGPSHPSTHGVLRLVVTLDGEVVTSVEPDIGYLHRGDEKLAENLTYAQFIPYTDRLDYLAPLANNVAYVYAVEKLLGVEVPPRCHYVRAICAELA